MRQESGSRSRVVARALVVEDDEALARAIADMLGDEGYRPTVVRTASEARAALASCAFAVMVLDLTLPDEFGRGLLEEVDARDDGPPTLIVSGFALAGIVAAHDGVEVLSKPFDAAMLVAALRRTITNARRPRRQRGALLGA